MVVKAKEAASGTRLAIVKPQLSSYVADVTPAIAKAWLENMAPNRKVSDHDRRVATWSKVMKRGDWKLAEPLKFDTLGRLIDGQHRLLALIKASVTVQFLVVEGYDPDTMLILDSGKTRTVDQNLQITGHHATKHHISVLNAMFVSPNKSTNSRLHTALDRQLLADLFCKHEEAIRFASAMAKASTIACKSAPIRGAIARAYYHVDHEALNRFIYILDGGRPEEPRDYTVFTLRNKWMQVRKDRSVYEPLNLMTLTALKAFFDGKDLKSLRQASTQYYPVADFD